jgi:hypothetical protein
VIALTVGMLGLALWLAAVAHRHADAAARFTALLVAAAQARVLVAFALDEDPTRLVAVLAAAEVLAGAALLAAALVDAARE